MITTDIITKKIHKLKQIDDLVAINHYVDYLLYREQNDKTELGQTLINGLEEILEEKFYSISSSKDILEITDEL